MTDRTNIGFVGLQSLVSDVGTAIREEERRVAEQANASTRAAGGTTAAQSPGTESAPVSPASQPRPAPKATLRWNRIAIAAALVGVMVLINMDTKGSTTSGASAPASAAPEREATDVGATGLSLTPYADDPAGADPTKKQDSLPDFSDLYPTDLKETRPAAGGRERVLEPDEVRYCLAEEMRLTAAESGVNMHGNAAIALFNVYVDDYNARCGRYQYRVGTLERVRAEVERRRSTLESEGRSRF